ncbi:DUF494 family protein [Pantoea ananatis]
MFDVLMYLFETYIHNEAEMGVDQDRLTDDLTDAGFHREDIYNALNWLENWQTTRKVWSHQFYWQMIRSPCASIQMKRQAFRCRKPRFLLFLEQIQVLSLETREMVIERVMALDTLDFDLEDLKWWC